MMKRKPQPRDPGGTLQLQPVPGGTVHRISVGRAKAIREAAARGDRATVRALTAKPVGSRPA